VVPEPAPAKAGDGSTHRWIAGIERDLDLIVTLDDATGAILSAFLVEEEGTMSSFLGLLDTIGAHGLFSAFYTDRGSHYFHPKFGGCGRFGGRRAVASQPWMVASGRK
jgi:hypothetical protein